MSITLQYPVSRQPAYPQKVARVKNLIRGARKAVGRRVRRGALGIFKPGDYMRDYGHDPVAWIKKELDGQLPATIGVPQ